MYTLFTDTDTDLTPVEAKEYGYKMISMPYIVNEKEIYPYEDFEEFDYHSFYQSLRDGLLPSTCGISPLKYKEYFEPELKAGRDILYVHFSAAMSGTFNAMNLALEELKEEYPNNNVYLIDTKGITLGSINIVKEIGDMYKAGKSIEEIQAWAKEEVDKFAVYFYANDLKFFKRSGRVSGLAAFMGGIIGIRPIIYMGSDGKMTSIGKARGKKNTLDAIINYVVTLGDNIEDHRIIIHHTDALESAQELAKALEEKLGKKLNIEFGVVNPTAGAHCGPDAVGISFHAIHR